MKRYNRFNQVIFGLFFAALLSMSGCTTATTKTASGSDEEAESMRMREQHFMMMERGGFNRGRN